MFKLDDNLLKELGLGELPAVEKNKMLGHIYETLEMRVGMTLAQQMTDEQLTEFESYIDSNDEAGALKWLETNFPNYKQVVADELEKLKAEIKVAAPQIVASAQQQQVPEQPQAPVQPSV
jgi:predicted RNA-binding Zn ribbon-like protein